MYLRSTKRQNKDGSKVEYYQLAHNERHPITKQSAPKIIHSFGRADQIDREELTRLCRSIARVCGLVIQDPLKENEAQISIGAKEIDLPEGMKQIVTVELGPMVAIEAIWEQFGIGPELRQVTREKKCKVPYERALLAMTANRLCEPESKLGVWDRWLETIYLPSADILKLDHMYEAMDLLHEHNTRVEETVFFQTADLMNLEVDLIFYDTTTTSFSIDYEDEDDEESEESSLGMRKFGRNKEGIWTPQVIVALAVTKEGIPVRSWVFPGNTSDVETVSKVKKDLKGWKLGRAMFVADAGMNSKENRQELGKACGKYLLAMRMGSVKEVKEEVLTSAGRYKNIAENLQAKEVVIGDGERRRRYILCYNPKEAERQRKHRKQVISDLEGKLEKHRDRKATSKWAIELLASMRYKRYLKITKANNIRIDRKAVNEAEKYDGKWVVITNDDTISVEDAASGYKGLMVIERCFRALKRSQIKMGPMYHWLPHRIESHVKICVLALLIERIAEIRCGQPWSRIRRGLRKLQATEYHTEKFRFFRRNEAGSDLQRLLNLLKIPLPKLILGIFPLAENL